MIAEINQALEQTATATPAAPAAPVEAPVVEAPAATRACAMLHAIPSGSASLSG